MPIVKGNYIPPGIFKSADASTIYAAVLRKVEIPLYERERIELSDGDFLDLDWSYQKEKATRKVAILLHGLAGNANRVYMKGMAKALNAQGWDVAAMNFRGCSDELNRYFKSYHAGASEDLAEVITHVLTMERYEKISIVGFSLGGNIVLKYLGENRSIPSQIKAAACFSVPCDLQGSLGAITRMRNFVYSKRFELNLKEHLRSRAEKFPKEITKKEIDACGSILEIDELYTSQAHGFKNASDYYKRSSANNFLGNIRIPTYLISAENDTFLSRACYPFEIARKSEYIHLEVPRYGGHMGFVLNQPFYYHEQKAAAFLKKYS